MADRVKIMLPTPYEERKILRLGFPLIVQPKLEGDRLRSEPRSQFYQAPILKSSSDKVRVSIPVIAKEMAEYMPHTETDGEAYIHGMPHRQIRSIVGRTKNLHPEHWKMQYHIYDLVTDDDQETRLDMKDELFKNIPESSRLKNVEWDWIHCLEDFQTKYDEYLNRRYEGIIIRHPNRPYKRTQVTWMLKLKPRLSGVFTIVGYELLVDQFKVTHEGVIGAFILEDQEGRRFNVGTGFLSDDRKLFFNHFDRLYMGSCKIRFQNYTSATGVPKMQSLDKEWLKIARKICG